MQAYLVVVRVAVVSEPKPQKLLGISETQSVALPVP